MLKLLKVHINIRGAPRYDERHRTHLPYCKTSLEGGRSRTNISLRLCFEQAGTTQPQKNMPVVVVTFRQNRVYIDVLARSRCRYKIYTS